MHVLNYSDFRRSMREKFDQITDDGEIVIVNRNENKAVVVLSLAEYNSILETMHLLRSEKNRNRLAEAMARTENGQSEHHDLIEE